MAWLVSVFGAGVGVLVLIGPRLASVGGALPWAGTAFLASAAVHGVLLVACYAGCVFLDPGVYARVGGEAEADPGERGRYCRECRAHTPWGVTHCHACRCCIVRLDHHCTVVGCCVGDGNLEYFEGFAAFAQTFSWHVYFALAFFLCAKYAGDRETLAIFMAIVAILASLSLVAEAKLPARRVGLAARPRHRLDRGAKALADLPRTPLLGGRLSLPRSLTPDDIAAMRNEFLEDAPSLFRDEARFGPPPMPPPPREPPPNVVHGVVLAAPVDSLPLVRAAPLPVAVAAPIAAPPPTTLFRETSDDDDDDGRRALVPAPRSPAGAVVKDEASGKLSTCL